MCTQKVVCLLFVVLCCKCVSAAKVLKTAVVGLNEDLWHKRYVHLGYDSLRRLSVEQLVDGFEFDSQKLISFCKACAEGKHYRSLFPTGGGTGATETLHTNICGKLSLRSAGGADYFVTFIDHKSRYVWLYVLKSKSEVFSVFESGR